MYASKVFQSIRLSTSRLSTAVCSALAWRRVCMMGWTVGKPKLEPWPGRKLCCQAGFEFFDHTRWGREKRATRAERSGAGAFRVRPWGAARRGKAQRPVERVVEPTGG